MTRSREKDATDAPQQEKLVTTAEEPVDMTPPAPEPAPEPEPEVAELSPSRGRPRAGRGRRRSGRLHRKARIGSSKYSQDAEADIDTQVAAIAPRKVRTMVVKADGTLVPREDPAPTAAVEPQAPASEEAAASEALAEPPPPRRQLSTAAPRSPELRPIHAA